VEFTQRLQTRGSQGTAQQPYTFSAGYELFRLRPTRRVQPPL